MWDAIVVGAGPAGSSAAYRLARGGRRVLVLERSRMPRVKPCGGAVSALAASYLDFAIPEELIDSQCFGARVHFEKWDVQVKLPERIAVLVTRSAFDHWLLKTAVEAGAEARFEAVDRLLYDEEMVTACTASGRYRARLVIIASGVASRLIRQVRRPDNRDEVGFCLEQDYPRPDPDPRGNRDSVTDIYFGVTRFSCGWVFDHGSYYSVGIGGLRSRMRRPMEVMRRFWVARGFPVRDLRPRGCLLPCGGVERRLVAPRAMLVGDAAGFADPISGEGIAYAIRSGQLAAETAEIAFGTGDFSVEGLSIYAEKCRADFDRALGHALLAAKVIHRFPWVFVRFLACDPRVLRKFLTMALGKLSYGGFLTWLLARSPALAAKQFLFA
jgi:geranylgeranyl reductase family protein